METVSQLPFHTVYLLTLTDLRFLSNISFFVGVLVCFL